MATFSIDSRVRALACALEGLPVRTRTDGEEHRREFIITTPEGICARRLKRVVLFSVVDWIDYPCGRECCGTRLVPAKARPSQLIDVRRAIGEVLR